MTFGDAMIAAAHGRFVRRACSRDGWHLRMFHPIDAPDGAVKAPKLRWANGWPFPAQWYVADFTADDVLAEDWETVGPSAVIGGGGQVEIIPCGGEEDNE